MKQKTITVSSSLEARAAALFVQTACKFQSAIKIQMDNREANAKSIMGIISLGVLEGNTITITAEGADEDNAIAETASFFTSV